jgi:integrase/recombinase XerC
MPSPRKNTATPPAPAPERPTLPGEVHAYFDHLRTVRRLSVTTLRTYHTDFQTLLVAATKVKAQALDTFTERDVRALAVQLRSQALTARSIGRMLSVLRGYFEWRVKYHGLAENAARHVRPPKSEKRLPKALPVDAALALMQAPHAATPTALRNAAMAELMYGSGLRISELIGLDTMPSKQALGWIDLQEAEASVTGKGNKRRSVPVGSAALQALRAWLGVRDQLAKPHESALFVGARGTRIGGTTVREALKAQARAAGSAVHVHPHMLRHSFASHVLQSSQDLRAVQELMGHTSIAATQVYTKLDFQHLAKVYDAAHPRAKKRSS